LEDQPDQHGPRGYSYDRGRHKQTGEITFLNPQTGYYNTYFPIDLAITDKYGNAIQRRNRMSYAILHQVSGEYNGKFFDGKLDVLAGIRAPFFKRNLTTFCFATNGTGGYDCPSPQDQAAYAAANPTYGVPQNRNFNYNKVLPNVGFTLALAQGTSLYANYSKGLQVPGTDTLYNSFFYAVNSASGSRRRKPRTTLTWVCASVRAVSAPRWAVGTRCSTTRSRRSMTRTRRSRSTPTWARWKSMALTPP
jgi:iron complex outermembrane receptor protein